MGSTGRMLLIVGLILIIVGLFLTIGEKLGLRKLPGDILIKRGNLTFFFPIVSSIIISLILTLILNLFRR